MEKLKSSQIQLPNRIYNEPHVSKHTQSAWSWGLALRSPSPKNVQLLCQTGEVHAEHRADTAT